MGVSSILLWKNKKLALRKSKCSLCCQFIFPIGMMALAIVLKMAINTAQGMKCTPADRANPNNDCEFLAFDPFVAAYGQGNGGLWFSSASNQCQPGGVTMFYAPQGNPAVQAVMQQAAQLAETRTGLNGPNFAFTARGVRSESDIPASFLAYPSDACSFFVDFTETCGETDTASCAPWHYVVRPPFVPGGYNGATSYRDQRSWFTSRSEPCYDPKLSIGPRSSSGNNGFEAGNSFEFGSDPGYPNHAFLTVQQSVTLALASTNISKLETMFHSTAARTAAFNTLESIQLQRLPYPEYFQSIWAVILPVVIPWMVLWFSSVSVIKVLVADMVIEKENKLTVTMKMMGLSNSDWRMSWFKRGLAGYLPTLTVISILGMISDTIPATFTVTLVFLWAFGIAVVCFGFLVASLGRVSTTATLFSVIGWLLFFLPWIIVYSGSSGCSTVTKAAQGGMCLLAPSCMGIGVEIMSTAAYTSSELSWSNIAQNDVGGNITFGSVIIMLLFDSLWMYLLAMYIENVFPGEFGTPASPFFPFLYCLPFLNSKKAANIYEDDEDVKVDRAVREAYSNAPVGIEVRNVTKVYPPRTVGGSAFKAVDNLSVKMHANQVTALLGQNGAGKSTTMNMLCGLFAASDGEMRMNGHDIQSNEGRVYRRSNTGIAPQHDVLWDMLTVYEHLVFFAVIKGMDQRDAEKAATDMLAELALVEKRNVYTKSLSGGQKRRLSVAIAMIGGSSIVVLDEPTSGVDPQSARQIWELIQRNKQGRTILLSTHSMEEADVLADRIAIIADGRLVCDGSAMFLKKTYGVGYTLTIAKTVGCDADKVASIVGASIRGAEVTSDIGSELQIKLPKEESPKFPAALRELERQQSELFIDSMGISVTTLEEVFLQAALQGGVEVGTEGSAEPIAPVTTIQDREMTLEDGDALELQSSTDLSTKLLANTEEGRFEARVHAPSSYLEQVSAVMDKNLLVARRNPLFFSMLLVVPLVLMIFGATYSVASTAFNPLAPAPAFSMTPSGTVLLETGSSSASCTGLCEYAKGTYLRDKSVSPQVVQNVSQYVGNITYKEQSTFNKNTQLAFSFGTNTITAFFNGQFYHTPSIALKTASAIVLSNATTRTFDDLVLSNYPQKQTAYQASQAGRLPSEKSILWSNMNLFAQVIFTSLLVFRPIKERAANAKLMQLVSGASFKSYWAGFFAIDFGLSLILAIVPLILLCTGGDPVVDKSLASYLFLLNVLYYIAVLPFVYIVSCIMSTPAYGFALLFLSQYILNIIPDVFNTMCAVQPGTWSCKAKDAFLWIPIYCLTSGQSALFTQTSLMSLARTQATPTSICQTESECCKLLGCPSSPWNLKDPGIGKQCIALIAVTVALWLVLAFIETRMRGFSWVRNFPAPAGNAHVDPDVKKEEDRVMSGRFDDNVVIRQVGKHFGSKRAVDGITFGVPPRSCFGLLGVNGAGKTTTFKMITGEHPIGFGTIQIAGYDVKTQLSEVQRRIGYVPQFDALVGDLNAKELLAFYARLRGIPAADVTDVVERLIDHLDLRKHCRRLCKTYSGGNKRKLSVACALIGDPQILLLDEPTTGMDPGGKRYLWNVVLGLVEQGRSIVLTSHSMEECEALASQLTIMVDGKMRCFGSVQHLKAVHGTGYIIQVVTPESEVAPEAVVTEDAAPGVMAPPGQAPLPPNWEARQDPNTGRWFYQNNLTKVTQWEHPTTLPPFWAEMRDAQGKVYYQNEATRVTQWEHPGLSAPVAATSAAAVGTAIGAVQTSFPKAVLKDTYGSNATFHLNDPSVAISSLFETLERLKQSGDIREYSVGQSSLESIFRGFAQQANEQQLVTTMRQRSGTRNPAGL